MTTCRKYASDFKKLIRSKKIKKIYLAGKITGDPGYREKFRKFQEVFEMLGYRVMNPAILPNGFEYEEYMGICFTMIDACDAICFLPDYQNSPGALREEKKAKRDNIIRIYLVDEPVILDQSDWNMAQ